MSKKSDQPEEEIQQAAAQVEMQDLVEEFQEQLKKASDDLIVVKAMNRKFRRETLTLAQGLQALENQVRELGHQPVTDTTPRAGRRATKKTSPRKAAPAKKS